MTSQVIKISELSLCFKSVWHHKLLGFISLVYLAEISRVTAITGTLWSIWGIGTLSTVSTWVVARAQLDVTAISDKAWVSAGTGWLKEKKERLEMLSEKSHAKHGGFKMESHFLTELFANYCSILAFPFNLEFSSYVMMLAARLCHCWNILNKKKK